MFENLFLLVKSNAGEAVIQNPVIPAGQSEYVINDASSSIIEVLKKQLDSGRLKDLIRFFKLSEARNNELVTSMVNRFANKLNKYYNIDPKAAFTASSTLIVPVIDQMVQQGKSGSNDFTMNTFLSKLSGGNDLSVLVDSYLAA